MGAVRLGTLAQVVRAGTSASCALLAKVAIVDDFFAAVTLEAHSLGRNVLSLTHLCEVCRCTHTC